MIRKKQENRKNDVTILAENRGKIAAPHGDLSSHVALRKSGLNEILPGYPKDQHTNVIDLLTDAMHWCISNDVEFDEVLRVARDHFEADMREPT